MTVLARIKRAVLGGRFELSEKARVEMFAEGVRDVLFSGSSGYWVGKAIWPGAVDFGGMAPASERAGEWREYRYSGGAW